MNWLQNMFSNLSNWMSTTFGGWGGNSGGGYSTPSNNGGNWFTNLFGGGGNTNRGPSQSPNYQPGYQPTNRPTLATPGFNPYQPNTTTTFGDRPAIDPATRAATDMATRQTMNVLNSSANRVLDNMVQRGGAVGWLGAVASPMVQASMDSAGYQLRANSRGAISCAPDGSPMGPTPNMRGQFGASCGAYEDRMAAARESSARAIEQRGMDRAIEIGGKRILDGIYTPRSQGGAFGDLMSKITGR